MTEAEQADISLTEGGHCGRLVLMSVIAPISHAYSAVANSLNCLIDNVLMESEFVKTCVKEITSKVENLECKYGK